MAMKRSNKIFLGAFGVLTLAWGAERALTPAPKAQPPECVAGADGKMPALPQCRQEQRSSSRSGGNSGYHGGGSWFGGSSSDTASHSTSSHTAASRGGFGGSAHGFSSGG